MTGGGGQIQVVHVRGELDLALADSLAVRGYAAIGRQARVLLLDLAGVSFCDACGLSALVGSLITLTGPGAGMASSRRSRRW